MVEAITSYSFLSIATRLTIPAKVTHDDVETLELFNKHADQLLNSLLIREGKERKVGFVMTWTRDDLSGPFTHTRDVRNHTREAIESAVLNLRFFMQNNERTSLQNMDKLYDKMPIDADLKTEFKTMRTKWHKYLSGFALTFEEQNATKEEIVDVMVFGEYAHHNKEKLARLKSWASNDLNRDLVNSQFEIILHELIRIIGAMKAANEKVLSQHATTATQQKQP